MFDCIIAAAGGSTRMGSPKQLLPFGSDTMVGTVVAVAAHAGCRVLVVVGHRGADVARAAYRAAAPFGSDPRAADRLVIVENPAWEEGMLGSMQAALRLVRGPAFFAMNADMPLVPASAYGILASVRDARNRSGLPEAAIFASSSGRRGHPVLIPSAWIPEILLLPRSGLMRDFLRAKPCELAEAGTDAVLADIDTPEEYRKAVEP